MLTADTVLDNPVPADVYKNYQDVRVWLAYLYQYCLQLRPHLRTKKGLAAVESVRHTVTAAQFNKDYQTWHIWLLVLVLRFHEMKWKGADYSNYPPPKLPDFQLIALIQHSIFTGEDIEIIIKNGIKVNAAGKKCLKELALRLS